MSLRVSGKNLDLGEALRGQVQDRITDAMEKYFGGGFSGHVTVAKDGSGFRTECSLHLDSGIVLQAAGAAPDAYASFDQACGRIETRLRRYKQRLKDHHPEGDADSAPYVVFESPDDDVNLEDEGWSPVIVAETTTALRRMTVGFAVMELDLTGAPVVVFRHAVHGRVNMVYRRADGNVGWIDPPPSGGGADGH